MVEHLKAAVEDELKAQRIYTDTIRLKPNSQRRLMTARAYLKGLGQEDIQEGNPPAPADPALGETSAPGRDGDLSSENGFTALSLSTDHQASADRPIPPEDVENPFQVTSPAPPIARRRPAPD